MLGWKTSTLYSDQGYIERPRTPGFFLQGIFHFPNLKPRQFIKFPSFNVWTFSSPPILIKAHIDCVWTFKKIQFLARWEHVSPVPCLHPISAFGWSDQAAEGVGGRGKRNYFLIKNKSTDDKFTKTNAHLTGWNASPCVRVQSLVTRATFATKPRRTKRQVVSGIGWERGGWGRRIPSAPLAFPAPLLKVAADPACSVEQPPFDNKALGQRSAVTRAPGAPAARRWVAFSSSLFARNRTIPFPVPRVVVTRSGCVHRPQVSLSTPPSSSLFLSPLD